MSLKFEERKSVVFENEEKKVFGMLHQPFPFKQSPAVLICHGFAGNKVGRYRIYVSLAERLAQMGVASLRIDFRGSGDSEGDFSEMTIGGEVSDALKGLEFLRAQPYIDSSRLGLLGNSFGGPVAVLTARQDRQIKSLALLAAIFTSEPWRKRWEFLKASTDPAAQKELARILEGYTVGKEFYREFFSLNLHPALEELHDLPLLHIHSEKDERVGIEQAEMYRKSREHARRETRWIRLHDCDHDFFCPKERAYTVDQVALWFKETL